MSDEGRSDQAQNPDRGGWSPEIDRELVQLLPNIQKALQLLPEVASDQAAIKAQLEERNKWLDAELRGVHGRLDEHSGALKRDLGVLSKLQSDVLLLNQRATAHNGAMVTTADHGRDLAAIEAELVYLRDACERMTKMEASQRKLEKTQYMLGLAIVTFSVFGPDIGKALFSLAGALVGGGP